MSYPRYCSGLLNIGMADAFPYNRRRLFVLRHFVFLRAVISLCVFVHCPLSVRPVLVRHWTSCLTALVSQWPLPQQCTDSGVFDLLCSLGRNRFKLTPPLYLGRYFHLECGQTHGQAHGPGGNARQSVNLQ